MKTRLNSGINSWFLCVPAGAAAALLLMSPPAVAQGHKMPRSPEALLAPLPASPKVSLEQAEFSPELLHVFQGGATVRSLEPDALPLKGSRSQQWTALDFSPVRAEGTASDPLGSSFFETESLPSQFYRPDYTPITPRGRFGWVMKSTFGFRSVTLGLVSSAASTARNNPEEWGPGWEGFGKRFGSGQATKLISSTIEASVGAMWGEDPRYLRSGRTGFWPRFGYAVKMAFLSYRKDGSVGFSYARFTGVAASRFVSSTWRPPSSDDWEDSATRIGVSYLSRMASNLWSEFWPEKWRRK